MAERLETGVFKPEGDWPGIFIRGDEALSYANRLRTLFAELEARAKAGKISEEEIAAWPKLLGLADLLETCRQSSAGRPAAKKGRPASQGKEGP